MGGKQYREVLRTFGLMRELGIELNVYSFSCVIKSFAGAKAFNQGLKTHGILVKNGLGSSSILRTSLIDLYFKCGNLSLRVEFLKSRRRGMLWRGGAMIAGFAHNRLQMRSVGVYEVDGEGRVVEVKFSCNYYGSSCYSSCGGEKTWAGGSCLCDQDEALLEPDMFQMGDFEQALRSIEWMQQEGFKPDTVTIATVLPVCGTLRALKQGKELHAYAVKNGFFPNVSIATSLMMMYSKCGLLEYSIRVFDKLEVRNVISWTAMIESNIESGCLHEALGVFRLMQLSQHRSDTIAISRMLSVCSGIKALKLGMEIHGQILKREFGAIPFVSAELIKMYGVCGAKNKAKLAFDVVPAKGSMTWTAIIEAYGSGGFYQEAIDLFKQMISNGSSPSHFTFGVVLSICDQAGFADEACKIFNLISRTYKIPATEEHYTTIIGLLSRCGRDEEAQRFIQLRSAVL
ncbi:Pentatricopeptide repeat-containing protein [Heracleum sosnowskyi]|uniref:Pentatricopeptide repeat-containing protein n=1 Tax=Heracleum sosnowskyi TaxID=360622 RepID=A0AAD8NE19_9APIA|nr:Pentatricopeptide repeat-containing protein [Heracleum sosnowskyi]